MAPNTRRVTEAVYANGVLRPLDALDLEEHERVRLVVEKLGDASRLSREALLARLREGIERMDFRSDGHYPRRDELHDRD